MNSSSVSPPNHLPLAEEQPMISIVSNPKLDEQMAESHDKRLQGHQKIIALAALCFAIALAAADQSGISSSLPIIATELRDAKNTISWAGTAQLIANCSFQLLHGRLSDIFGRKNILLLNLIGLALTDLACGLARTGVQFYIFRGFSGVFVGGIQSLTMITVSDIVGITQRSKYQGYLSVCIGLGNCGAPLISSVLAEYRSWRDYYWIMVPLEIICAGVIWKLIPGTTPNLSTLDKLKTIDYMGVFLSSLGLILVLIPVNGGGNQWGWGSTKVICMFVFGGLVCLLFLIWEARFARLPILPLTIFGHSMQLSLIFLECFFFGISFYPLNYYYPYYFQVVRGQTAFISAAFYICVTLPQSIFSGTSGQVVSYLKHYNPIILPGFLFWLLGCIFQVVFFKVNTPFVGCVFIMMMVGIGCGMTFQPVLTSALSHSYRKDRAVVISARNVMRSIGGSCGLAFCSLIFSNSLSHDIKSNPTLETHPEIQQMILSNLFAKIDYKKTVPSDIRKIIIDIYMSAVKKVFIFWTPIIGVCFLLSLLVKDVGLASKDVRNSKDPQDKQH